MDRQQAVRRRPDLEQHQGVIQSDLATNLFAVFIAILAALQIIAVASTTIGFKLRVTPERTELPQTLGLVRSWHPVLPINKKILIRNDRAIGLNLTPVGNRFVTGANPIADSVGVTDQSRPLRTDRAPSAFIVLLSLDPSAIFPQELADWSLEIAADAPPEFPEDIQRWIDAAYSIDIYVSVGQEERAWQLAAHLSALNVPLRFQVLPSETVFSFSRQTKYFGFEGVYK